MSSPYDPSTSSGPGPSFEPAGGSGFGYPASPAQPPAADPSAGYATPAGSSYGATPTGSDPYGQPAADPYGQTAADPYGQPAADPYGKPSADPYGQPSADPYGQPAGDPYGQQSANLYGQPATNLYGQPSAGSYGSYGSYGYAPAYAHQPLKSKGAAALLAFFLGNLGVHQFYLGKNGLGFGHLGLLVGGLFIMIFGGLMAAPGGSDAAGMAVALGYLLWVANGIWSFVDFIIILVKPESDLGR